MPDDWNRRAVLDAKDHIATGLTGAQFHIAGLDDARRLLEGIHSELTESTVALEIGCGIGRLMQFFALIFAKIHGIDVSTEMIERSSELLARHPNAHTWAGSGRDLSVFEDAKFDFVYSHHVFQHVPTKEIIGSYVDEVRRVIKPNGLFKFLVKYRDWDGAPAVPDTWHGVNVTIDDVERWRTRNAFDMVSTTTLDAHLAYVTFRAPR